MTSIIFFIIACIGSFIIYKIYASNNTITDASNNTITDSSNNTITDSSNNHNCIVSNWSEWSECDKSCGTGTQKRTRSIIKEGYNCPPLEESQSCNTQACPVDCTVSDWSSWSECDKSCGTGTQKRTRSIIKDTSNGGKTCPPLEESQSCNTQACAVDCVVSDWSNWSECDKSCGTGTQKRSRSIIKETSNGGQTCPPLEESQPCNAQACPVDCVVSDWSSWSDCDKSCGTGTQNRSRTIIIPPANGGLVCPNLTESRTCNTQNCPVDCNGEWSSYGPCNRTCGGGTQTRNYKVTRASAYGGTACPATDGQAESQSCNTQNCPINCIGNWTPWTTCSKTCGGGTQTRTYKITTPAQYGGTTCPITDGTTESQPCNTQNCPVNCIGEWGNYGTCTRTCGGGTQSRQYTIRQNAAYGGTNCPYDNGSIQTQACNTQLCPVNCIGYWTEWSACSASCGNGSQDRLYIVTQYPSNGGTNCEATGGKVETRSCSLGVCTPSITVDINSFPYTANAITNYSIQYEPNFQLTTTPTLYAKLFFDIRSGYYDVPIGLTIRNYYSVPIRVSKYNFSNGSFFFSPDDVGAGPALQRNITEFYIPANDTKKMWFEGYAGTSEFARNYIYITQA